MRSPMSLHHTSYHQSLYAYSARNDLLRNSFPGRLCAQIKGPLLTSSRSRCGRYGGCAISSTWSRRAVPSRIRHGANCRQRLLCLIRLVHEHFGLRSKLLRVLTSLKALELFLETSARDSRLSKRNHVVHARNAMCISEPL